MLFVSEREPPKSFGGVSRIDGWSRLLDNVSSLLECALDLEQTMRVVARLPVPNLADFSELYLTQEDGALRLVEHAHGNPDQERRAVHAHAWFKNFVPPPVVRAAITNEPLFAPQVDDALLESLSRDPQHLALLRKNRPRSLIVVPIRSPGGIVAALALGFSATPRQHDSADLFAALELARRAGAALDTAVTHRALQDEARARNQLLRVLSRALREPVRSLLHVARDGEDAARDGDLQRTYDAMVSIRHLGGRLSQLVDDLLEGPGSASLEMLAPEPVPVDELLRAAWERTRAPSTELVLRVAPGLPPVEVDRDRMTELLRDLLDDTAVEAASDAPPQASVQVRAIPCTTGIQIRIVTDAVTDGLDGNHAWWSVARQVAQAHRGHLERIDEATHRGYELTLPAPVR